MCETKSNAGINLSQTMLLCRHKAKNVVMPNASAHLMFWCEWSNDNTKPFSKAGKNEYFVISWKWPFGHVGAWPYLMRLCECQSNKFVGLIALSSTSI